MATNNKNDPTHLAKFAAISSNKGGVLKTSIAVNLAGAIAKSGKKVLIVDTDNQGNVATSFGINPDNIEFTIYDLLTLSEDMKDVHQSITHIEENLDIIVANDDMAYFEIDVLTDDKKYPNYFDLLKKGLANFKAEYDFIIVDTPPALGLVAANVFNAVQDIIIPFQPEEYAFRSLVKTVEAVSRFRTTNPELAVKEVVPTRVRRTLLHKAFTQNAEAYARSQNINFSDVVIKETIRYADLTARLDRPITLVSTLRNDLKPYSEKYTELAKELGYIG